jgi:hypothetical protein
MPMVQIAICVSTELEQKGSFHRVIDMAAQTKWSRTPNVVIDADTRPHSALARVHMLKPEIAAVALNRARESHGGFGCSAR